MWTGGGGSDTAIKQTQGQTTLPSGLILKWGYMTGIPLGGGRSVAFTTPFPNASLNATATRIGYSDNTIQIFGLSKTNIYLGGANNGGGGGASNAAFWQAIGY